MAKAWTARALPVLIAGWVGLLACAGLSGHQGDPGAVGATGEGGIPGDAGPAGKTGVTGLPGARGEAGTPGPRGEAGAKGEPGPTGAAGQPGEAGVGLVDLYGGADASVSFTSDTTLMGDVYYDDLTLGQNVTLDPNGYRIFVANVLTMSAGSKIARDGTTATAGTAAVLPSGTVGGGGAGQAVNDCSPTGGDVTNSLGGSAGTIAMADAGVATAPALNVGGATVFDSVTSAITGRTLDGALVMGGAGGSSCATVPGNGGGGGVIVLVARVIVVADGGTAVISANGGAAVGTPQPGTGIAGGGGGVIVVVTSVPQPAGLTLSVEGGASVGADGVMTTPGLAGSYVWLD